jgi:hypothetical protein
MVVVEQIQLLVVVPVVGLPFVDEDPNVTTSWQSYQFLRTEKRLEMVLPR